jgi:Fe2+ transport system protein FeoA
MRPLSELQPGDRARLTRVGGERGFRRRLMEMGILPGTEVRLVRSVGIGDLIELEVRGAYISLRLSEAKSLYLEPPR